MFFFEFGYAGFMNTFFATYAGEVSHKSHCLWMVRADMSLQILPTKIRAVGVACNYAMFNAIVILLVQVTRKVMFCTSDEKTANEYSNGHRRNIVEVFPHLCDLRHGFHRPFLLLLS